MIDLVLLYYTHQCMLLLQLLDSSPLGTFRSYERAVLNPDTPDLNPYSRRCNYQNTCLYVGIVTCVVKLGVFDF